MKNEGDNHVRVGLGVGDEAQQHRRGGEGEGHLSQRSAVVGAPRPWAGENPTPSPSVDGNGEALKRPARLLTPVRTPPEKVLGGYVYVAQCEKTGKLKAGTTANVSVRLRALSSRETPLRLVAVWRIKSRQFVRDWPSWQSWTRWLAEADLHARLHRWALGHEWFAPGAAATVARLRGHAYPMAQVPPQARYFSSGEFRVYLTALHAHGRSVKAGYAAVESRRRCERMRTQISVLKASIKKQQSLPFKQVAA